MIALLLALLACNETRLPDPAASAAPPPAAPPAPAGPPDEKDGVPWEEGGKDFQGAERVRHGATELRILATWINASSMDFRYQLSREGADPLVFEGQAQNLADMLSPDGAWLALDGGKCLDASGKCPDGDIQIYDIARRTSWSPGSGEQPELAWSPSRFAWSPDSARVAWTEDSTLMTTRLRLALPAEREVLVAAVSAHLVTGSMGVSTTPRWEDGSLMLPCVPAFKTDEELQQWVEAGKPTWELVRFDDALKPMGVVRTLTWDEVYP